MAAAVFQQRLHHGIGCIRTVPTSQKRTPQQRTAVPATVIFTQRTAVYIPHLPGTALSGGQGTGRELGCGAVVFHVMVFVRQTGKIGPTLVVTAD